MELAIYFYAIFIGLTMGLIGGGGSILTVPFLVYIAQNSPETATAYSLFIVGTSALAGTYKCHTQKQLEVKTAIIFALPSMLTIYITRKFLIPSIPEILIQFGEWTLTRGGFMMLLFSFLMLYSSIGMLTKKKKAIVREESEINYNPLFIVGLGLFLGLLTGLVGAGGGFLIIPALVLVANLPMKKAIGTSLMIICINSLAGFAGEIQNPLIDWLFLSIFSSISIIGILIGNKIVTKVPAKKLKFIFSYFVLAMAIIVLVNEISNL